MQINDMRIALLGVSHWHVPLYLAALPPHSVVGVSDDNEVLAAPYGLKYNCPVYTDYREMLKECRPDFVFAFAPHWKMKQTAMDLLNAGIPFTMEKPAGLSGLEVEELYDAAEQKNGFGAIPFVWRYSDTVNDLKEKYLTAPICHMSYRFVAGPPSRYLDTSSWMLDRSKAGGGCMTNLGVHFIDMALYLTDSSNADVMASIYQYGSLYDVELFASSLLQLSSGASLVLETGYAYPMTEDEKRENRWTIVTENGYFVLADNHLSLRESGGKVSDISINTDSDVYYPVFAHTSLEDYICGRTPRASLREMLVVRNILDKINALAEHKERGNG